MATQRMIPSMVVDMLMQTNIKEVKLFSASDNVMEAFGGTGIGLVITMPNSSIDIMMVLEVFAEFWINNNIGKFNNSVNFRYVYIGTQPLSRRFFNQSFANCTEVLERTQKALSKNFGHVKATISHYTDVLIPVQKPSEAEFKDELKPVMARQCQFLKKNDAPIGVDIFPLLAVNDLFNYDTEFAFFENNSTSVFQDGNKTYSNVFEVMYDQYDAALEKLGCPNMTIVVGEIGWPTDGIPEGNVVNAKRFHQGLAKCIASNKGTPRRPGPIDAYIHNLADENANNKLAGTFMRHWGIYKFDGQPKFNIDFEGDGRDNTMVSAIGITHMPKRWCIYNNLTTNASGSYPSHDLNALFSNACRIGDCTATEPGGSCSNLSYPQRISYGFNMGFQGLSQKVLNSTCDYDGYGKIVSEDPSTESCVFPVEILAAEIPNFTGTVQKSPAYALRPLSRSIIPIVQFLFIFFNLMCTW
ncbi:hypothetical protein ACH5RR_012542 [Cinchona calisaya]|uniref:X8 domain-containing protein n=1 Tax=Cinchona calisaya TaxID=153742 RepID=A0ABD3A804_9GENT